MELKPIDPIEFTAPLNIPFVFVSAEDFEKRPPECIICGEDLTLYYFTETARWRSLDGSEYIKEFETKYYDENYVCFDCNKIILDKKTKRLEQIKTMVEEDKIPDFSRFELILMLGLERKGCGLDSRPTRQGNKEFSVDVEWQAAETYPNNNDIAKFVDLAIHRARLYIEVNGGHHYKNDTQIWRDLWRSHYSDVNVKYLTLHIPNQMIENKDFFPAIVDAIKGIARERIEQIEKTQGIES